MKRGADIAAGLGFIPRLLKLTLVSAATIGLLLSLVGCNTMQGFGKDVEKAGEAIQKSTK